jgi:hypothetical protein
MAEGPVYHGRKALDALVEAMSTRDAIGEAEGDGLLDTRTSLTDETAVLDGMRY